MKNYQSPFIFFIKHLVVIIISLILSLQNAHADEKKNVVVTIKPLEGLVLAIAKNTVKLDRLLPDYTSLHNYHFRPSDIRKIKKAALIFRIDDNMERFLSPLLATLQQSKVVSLADDPHIQHLPINSSKKKYQRPT